MASLSQLAALKARPAYPFHLPSRRDLPLRFRQTTVTKPPRRGYTALCDVRSETAAHIAVKELSLREIGTCAESSHTLASRLPRHF